jgi:hypothetical protein
MSILYTKCSLRDILFSNTYLPKTRRLLATSSLLLIGFIFSSIAVLNTLIAVGCQLNNLPGYYQFSLIRISVQLIYRFNSVASLGFSIF